MVRVLAINNYPTEERFARLVGCFEDQGAAVEAIEWGRATAKKFNSFDGVVLSGSPDMMSEAKVLAKFRGELDAVLDSRVPVLGVCFGHQLMARAFGAEVVKDVEHVLGMVRTQVLSDDPLFVGLPRSLMLLESRYEVVSSLPKGFRLLASSETSKIAAMKHQSRPLYGTQFHPERYTKENPDGKMVVGNFVRLLR